MDDEQLDRLIRSAPDGSADLAGIVRRRRAAGDTGAGRPALPRGLVAGFLGLMLAAPVLSASMMPAEADLLGRLALGDASLLMGFMP